MWCCWHAQDPGPWPQTQPRGPRAGTEPQHTVLGPAEPSWDQQHPAGSGIAAGLGAEQSCSPCPNASIGGRRASCPASTGREAEEPTPRSLHVPLHVK